MLVCCFCVNKAPVFGFGVRMWEEVALGLNSSQGVTDNSNESSRVNM